MKARYKHTNIIASDWRKLADFYIEVFGCEEVPPERHLDGQWLEDGTGVADAALSGVHLRLPGCGAEGPTLEIFQYRRTRDVGTPGADCNGLRHIAFEVEDTAAALEEVLSKGGVEVAQVGTQDISGVGRLSFVYVADPEGNLIELQDIKPSSA